MISSEFRKEEYWLVKWPLLTLALSLMLSAGLLSGLNYLDSAAATDLRRARSDLDDARDRVDKIEEEEATIIEYIGRYREMAQDGVVAPEDRLQFQEEILEFRSLYSLFPVGLNIEGQKSLPLEFPDGRTERGREIVLNTSLVELNLPLLHENDLANLLLSIVNGPGLFQPLSCSLSLNGRTTNFIFLAQHFDAACSLHWYSFKLPPPEDAE
jgi:hypothetical protein